jgi:Tol biopolymer transport system component
MTKRGSSRASPQKFKRRLLHRQPSTAKGLCMSTRLTPRRSSKRRLFAALAVAAATTAACTTTATPPPITSTLGLAHSVGAQQGSITRHDGAVLMVATKGERSAQNPALSPDGATLFFTRYLHGYDATLGSGGGLLQTKPAGGSVTDLYDRDEATNVNGLASWNGSTQRIAFAVSSGNGDIATVDSHGHRYFRVTHADANHTYLEPTYSPDGRTIVFEDDQPNGVRSSIDKVSAAGGPITVLVDGRRTATDNRLPVWSPDGSKILFQRRVLPSQVYDLYTIRPDGTHRTQITTNDNCDSDASWSADGQWIADSACFSGFGPTPHSNIYLVSSNGSVVIRATCDVNHEDGAPTISQDRRWIYFESHHGDDNTPTQIWRIRFPSHSVRCP